MRLLLGPLSVIPLLAVAACSGASASIPTNGDAPDAARDAATDSTSPIPSPATDGSSGPQDSAREAASPADAPASPSSDASSDTLVPECTTGQASCAGQTPETCVDGQWQFASAPCSGADPICVNGGCGECSPMQTACGHDGDAGSTAIQVCDGTGHWRDNGAFCPYGCVDNQCGPREIVADAQPFGAGIASNGIDVYWFSGFIGATIDTCPVSGCSGPAVSVVTNVSPSAYFGNALAMSPQYLYWPNGTTVAALPLGIPGASAGVFAPGTATSSPFQVVVDGSNVYWSDSGTSSIYQCALGPTCASPVTLVGPPPVPDGGSAVAPQLIAVDGVFLYWSDTAGNVNSMALGGGPVVLIAAGTSPSGLVAVAGRAYWTGLTAVYSCPANSACTNVYDPDPGSSFSGVATDGVSLYWSDSGGSVSKCGLGPTCTSPTVVASNLDTPSMLAVDTTNLFWLAGSASGAVFEYSK